MAVACGTRALAATSTPHKRKLRAILGQLWARAQRLRRCLCWRATNVTANAPSRRGPPSTECKEKLVSETAWEYWNRYQLEHFGSVANIPDRALIELASKFSSAAGITSDQLRTAEVIRNTQGSNNRAFMIEFGGDEASRICIRVPACGRPGMWTAKDAEVLRDYALVMNMIKEKTSVPVPAVFGYDTTMDNVIEAPYIAMEFARGRPIDEIWYDEGEGQEAKRQQILKSLATAIAGLRQFEFSKMGSVKFHADDDKTPYIGESYSANFGNTTRDSRFFDFQEDIYVEPPARSSWAKATTSLAKLRHGLFDRHEDKELSTDSFHAALGACEYFKCMNDIISKHTGAPKEKFVLCHPDYNWQNILADEDGNITALIDWDRMESKPVFSGWSRVPDFLEQDWEDDYQWPSLTLQPQMSSADFSRYRADFTRYMKETTSEEECKFTAKSALFDVAYAYAGSESQQQSLLYRILAIIDPMISVPEHLMAVGALALHGEDPLTEYGLKAKLEALFSV